MSTRFYPRFVKGNPQLRIFLPDWKMVMIKPKHTMPQGVVSFKVDPRMTDWDIKNYLEKIYKVPVASIQSNIFPGTLKRTKTGLAKDADYKIAHVNLPLGQKFTWPDLFPKEKLDENLEDYNRTMKELNKGRELDPNTPQIPSWFT